MSVSKVVFGNVDSTAVKPMVDDGKGIMPRTSKTPEEEQAAKVNRLMIGATALAAVIALGIAGRKGYLGEGIQKFLGGAEKTSGKATTHSAPSGGRVNIEENPTSALDRGIYDQDIYDPLEPMNAYDSLSPYYKPVGVDPLGEYCGYGSYGGIGGF